MAPSDRKYVDTHEWIKIENDLAVVGLTDYAQDCLGDITFVELPAVDTEVTKGGECCVVESVKAAADVYLPVGGTVTEFNEDLLDNPELVNSDPYGEAWMVKIELSGPNQLDALLEADAYQKHCDERSA